MELHNLQKPVISLFKGMSVLVLAVAVLLGWSILLLAALSTLSDFLPILSGVISPGKSLVLDVFFLILLNPLEDIVVLFVGGYLIQRKGWADWL
jgi:hypothetical protein